MFELVPSLYMRSLFEDLNFELSDFNKASAKRYVADNFCSYILFGEVSL